jgi:hypothetical protein
MLTRHAKELPETVEFSGKTATSVVDPPPFFHGIMR